MLEIALNELPRKISTFDAVEQCYQEQLRVVTERLKESISIIIRCEKQIIPYLQSLLKRRLATEGKTISVIDGRALSPDDRGTRLSRIVGQLRDLVNNTEENKIFFLPYLDIITSTSMGSLSQEAKEIMTIIHENPLLTLVAFEDPDFKIPELIAQAFPARCEMLGIGRNRMESLITEQEARKFAVDKINLMNLFKYVSGLNPVRFREIMGIFSKKADLDTNVPEMLQGYLRELREYTACGGVSLSDIQLETDIAGYEKVKKQIKENILNLLQATFSMNDEKEIKKVETIIPRGIIFHGPPGTGKTLFAKGIAEALNAAIYIVSGPELKSKWVGEGEANIRRLFARARATSPSVIVFDEIDSIAAARSSSGGDSASQAAHSMVNQLLTEMDGFRKEQMVLVVATTNFVESLDSAFLRPGRFEFKIEIPYPEFEDRKSILTLYNKKFETGLDDKLIEKISLWTARATDTGTPYTGDHLSALVKDLKRFLINEKADTTNIEIVDKWLSEKSTDVTLTDEERLVVGTHEVGHALMFFKYNRQDEITKVTLESEGSNALGFVESRRKNHNIFTENKLKSEIGISLGGYIAEKLVFKQTSCGASQDLKKATAIATDMVFYYGMGGIPRNYTVGSNDQPDPYFMVQLSPKVDKIINDISAEVETFMANNLETLKNVVTILKEKRTLSKDEMIELVKLKAV